jgi:hypothetical protein
MQKTTVSERIEKLDNEQRELVDSLKLDYKVMLAYINQLVEPAKQKAIVTGR